MHTYLHTNGSLCHHVVTVCVCVCVHVLLLLCFFLDVLVCQGLKEGISHEQRESHKQTVMHSHR